MRKQTKLVAVLSAAALLALGASMTSFAAGWEKDEAGIWHYMDSDGEMVTDEWKKDGSKWYYLDEEGDLLTDSWVDDEKYVGPTGAMVVNDWVKTLSSDEIDDPEDDGENWYYFDNKGKKLQGTSKRINGKTYYFDGDGKMRYGWYTPDAGATVYYLGGEDDGARVTNDWRWLESVTDEGDSDKDWHTTCAVRCDDEGWYWFGADGKMYRDATKKKNINGKYYYFNADGQMLYEWINTNGGFTLDASSGSADAAVQSTPSYMEYANQVEDGSRAAGWYEIAGAVDAGKDNDTAWYYFNKGAAKKATIGTSNLVATSTTGANIYRAKIKIDGKYYCFDEYGQRKTGLQLINNGTGVDTYYFGDDGAMKTGKVTVTEDNGDVFTYYFNTKNAGNGKGITGPKDGYLYWNGKRLEADDDYRLYQVDGQKYLVDTKGKIQKSTSKVYTIENLTSQGVSAEAKLDCNTKTGAITNVKIGTNYATNATLGTAAPKDQDAKVSFATINPYENYTLNASN